MSNRVVFDGPLPPPVPMGVDHIDEWMARSAKVQEMLERAERRPIGLAHDGEDFHTDTARETATLLEYLKDMGYNVPQYAIDTLLEEAAEEENGTD